MTNIKVSYNPFTKETKVYNEKHEIAAAENKLHTFLNTNGFYDCLVPFRTKYVIWEGLLPELFNEANDDELRITFEGRESDFAVLKEAFERSETVNNGAGDANKWSLVHIGNFDVQNLLDELLDLAQVIREICETREELNEINQSISGIKKGDYSRGCQSLQRILSAHIHGMEQEDDRYRSGKTVHLEMTASRLDEISARLEKG